VLRPGGRVAVADIVRTADLPPDVARDLGALCGCVAGAATVDELTAMLCAAGFSGIRIQPKDASREFIRNWVPGANAGDYVVSATIEAVKPQ
jgi:arsenite methyltransferase